jgi:bifunctional UDP-N-acetylglucosamine pyrophosphorylase / glucosamine-1-phosphate N-acetyltransferase
LIYLTLSLKSSEFRMKVKAQSTAVACVILAAGKGTRMRGSLPKVMHAVAHKPMLMHVIDAAREMKAEKIITVTAPDMHAVRDAVTKQYGNKVENILQLEARGTADAVRAAETALKGFSGIVLILYGDAPLVCPSILSQAITALNNDPKVALAVIGMQVHSPNAYGRLVRNAKGELERIVEVRDASETEKTITLCNSGIMAVRGELLFSLLAKVTNNNAKGEYYLTDLAQLARKDNHRCAVVTGDAGELLGVNSRTELASAEAIMQQRLRTRAMENGATLLAPETVFFSHDTRLGENVIVHQHVIFGPGVEVENGAEIRSFAHIEGAKILSDSVIGPFARLRPGTVIGESAHVGNFVEIKKSALGRNVKANHLSYIGDTNIGESTNIGAGTITANFDGMHKHRTVIGEGVSVGANTVLVAPVTVGDGAVVGAGSVITEDVEADALAVARAQQKQKPGWAKSARKKKQN